MNAREGGSITGWLGNLKDGDQAAAQPLWEHYFSKLVTVARTKLRRMRQDDRRSRRGRRGLECVQ